MQTPLKGCVMSTSILPLEQVHALLLRVMLSASKPSLQQSRNNGGSLLVRLREQVLQMHPRPKRVASFRPAAIRGVCMSDPITVDFQHSANAGILTRLRQRSRDAVLPNGAPDAYPDPYMGLGTHPDLVARLWDEITVSLPAKCQWIINNRPVLVHPDLWHHLCLRRRNACLCAAIASVCVSRSDPERGSQSPPISWQCL